MGLNGFNFLIQRGGKGGAATEIGNGNGNGAQVGGNKRGGERKNQVV